MILTCNGIMTRESTVEEARTWLRTPYHKGAHVKGAGVDCGTILFEIYRAAGFISAQDQEIFNRLVPVGQDWFCHTTEEKYVKLVLRHAHQVLKNISYRTLDAQPGNIAVTHHSADGKLWNHGGIVTKWPMVIHSVDPYVEEVDATQHCMWCYREVTIFDPWEKLALDGVT